MSLSLVDGVNIASDHGEKQRIQVGQVSTRSLCPAWHRDAYSQHSVSVATKHILYGIHVIYTALEQHKKGRTTDDKICASIILSTLDYGTTGH